LSTLNNDCFFSATAVQVPTVIESSLGALAAVIPEPSVPTAAESSLGASVIQAPIASTVIDESSSGAPASVIPAPISQVVAESSSSAAVIQMPSAPTVVASSSGALNSVILAPSAPTVAIIPTSNTPSDIESSSGATSFSIDTSSFFRKTGISPGRQKIEAMYPLPSAARYGPRKRLSQCSTVLTSSPYKKKLIEDKNKRRPAKALKISVAKMGTQKQNSIQQPTAHMDHCDPTNVAKKGRTKKTPIAQKKQGAAKKMPSVAMVKKGRTKKTDTVKKKQRAAKKTSSVANEDECWCLVCGEPYEENGEEWIRCNSCLQWAHVLCTAIESQQIDFLCDSCANNSD